MVTRATKTAALVMLALASAAGCAQVFGLEGYGQEPADGGEDVTVTGDSGHPGDSGAPSDAAPMDSASDAARTDSGSHDAGLDGPVFAADACTGGYTCAPAAPAPWQGPLVLWTGTGMPPSCLNNNYYSFFEGGTSLGTVESATCACSCGPASGATCGAVTAQFGSGGCSSSCGSASIAPNACPSVQTTVSGCGSGPMFTVSGSTASGGTCQPDASVTVPPATWTTEVVACAPLGTSPNGCPAGEKCVPPLPTGYGSTFCILQAGNNQCPSGPYSTSHLYYGGIADSRGCSSCTCGSATGVDCNANAQISTWPNTNCNTTAGVTLTSLPSACTALGGAHAISFKTTPDGGSCAAGGGAPIGSASATDITTLCCTQ